MRFHIHHSSKKRTFARAIRAAIVLMFLGAVGFGGLVVYKKIALLGADASDTVSHSAITVFANPIPERSGTTEILDSNGVSIGTADRARNADGSAVIKVHVPSLLPQGDVSAVYHLWMIKDGLADVVHVGTLEYRADGTWFAAFTLSPQTGILEADRYGTCVITQETSDAVSIPSKIILGKAQW